MRRMIALAATLALLSPTLAAPFYTVPSSSMMPTLGEGDTVFAVPYTAAKHRGDIVVFAHDNSVHISRIMGLPGEAITVIGGIVFIARTPFEQDPLAEPIPRGCPPLMYPAKKCAFYRETLDDGSSHVIISTDRIADIDFTDAVIVGPGEYFVMSDHRDSAVDSRTFGPIKDSAIFGYVQNLTASPRADSWAERLEGFSNAK